MWCHVPLLLPVLGLVLFFVLPFPVAAPLYTVVAIASWLLYRLTMQALRLPVKTGSEGMAGGLAYVVDPLSPEGVVRYGGELWRAVGDERIERGQEQPCGPPGDRSRWGGQASLAVVLLFAAALLAAQVGTERTIRREIGVGSTRLQEVSYQLRRAEAARQRMEREVTVLREEAAELAHAAAEGEEGLRRLTGELHRLKALAGLTPVSGPGIVLEVRDSPRKAGPGEDPNDVLVHYTDLRAILNDLLAAGAEAIAINGERFGATSAIVCVGTTVLVNGKRLVPPFRIEAIGDPARLKGHVLRPEGAAGFLQAFGFPVTVAVSAKLTLPAYRGALPQGPSRLLLSKS
ncbi:MAG: DUF881 domain-containing protein [Armatimonadota bacterium]|nr:DUF881 domain-containing protein [Armatimonadota bacterium]MDR7426504.1 DUF881 domain-containing protein [Armatimonadota bacterium]MDR7464767.1 DUF881 domain-containing protein [Armatimonadota bacterium]MDR7468544.1 DUF881 domain-containing protein [Armatimonadota bacterium]MDR7475137.1 DUF881 domain-containing protein [Armatimonadota bacterium]